MCYITALKYSSRKDITLHYLFWFGFKRSKKHLREFEISEVIG